MGKKKQKGPSPKTHPLLHPEHANEVTDCLPGMCAIYVLVDPRDRTVRYVGKTTMPRVRFYHHTKRKRPEKHHNSALRAWIKRLGRKRLQPRMYVIETVSDIEHSWTVAERGWIHYYRSQGHIFNIEDGGPSPSRAAKIAAKKATRIEAPEAPAVVVATFVHPEPAPVETIGPPRRPSIWMRLANSRLIKSPIGG